MKIKKAAVEVDGKVQWTSASVVIKAQNLLDAGKSTGEISEKIKHSRNFTQALVNSIKEHAQMGRVA